MAEISLKATKREATNKGAAKKLRRTGYVPGTFYSKGKDPLSFSVNEIELNPLVFTHETRILNLTIDENESLKCIIKDVQFDPVSDRIVHIDLIGVTVGQEMEIQIPINLVGKAPGIKQGGLLQSYLHKLDLACLPKDIPEHLDIDISGLNLGDTIHVRDLSYENVRLLNSEDTAVVAVVATRAGVDDEKAELDGELKEPEVIGKGKSEDTED